MFVKDRDMKVREWYCSHFPEDELGMSIDPNVTIEDVHAALIGCKDVYNIIGVGDSVIRERVFSKIAKVYRVSYDEIYKIWMMRNGAKKSGITVSTIGGAIDFVPGDVFLTIVEKQQMKYQFQYAYRERNKTMIYLRNVKNGLFCDVDENWFLNKAVERQ